MATQVQNRRGTTAEHSTFTGAVGEVTIDTDKDTVVVHDGATAGGRPLLREDQSNLPTSAPTTGIYNASGSLAISTNGTGRLFVDANGNIGLGTSSATNFANYQTLTLNDATGSFVEFKVGGTATHGIVADSTSLLVKSITNLPVVFGVNDTERMRLTATGLGIGSSNPQTLLHLSNTAQQRFSCTSTTNAISFWRDGTPSFAAEVGIGSATGITNALKFDVFNGSFWNTAVNIDSSSRVGIGTSSPATQLEVRSATTNAARLRVTGTGTTAGNFRGYEFGNGSVFKGGLLQDESTDLISIFTPIGGQSVNIDSSGRLLVGTSSARSNFYNTNYGSTVQIEGAGVEANAPRLSIVSNTNSGVEGPTLILARANGTTVGSTTVVANNDYLGGINFQGSDGTEFCSSASINAFVDGTPGANDTPGRLVFSTTADGASSPTERLLISSAGAFRLSNANYLYPNTDNAVGLGFNLQRWSSVWAANGTIQTSDERAKLDITTSTLGADFIKSLRPVSYKWIEGGKRDTGERDSDGNYIYESIPGERTHWGFIAQEVKQAVDAAGVDFGGWVLTDKDDPDSRQALRYDQFIAPLTKALQEALEKIETLEAKVAALESA